MLCVIYNKCMSKISVFNLEYHYELFLNLVNDAALGLFLEGGLQNTYTYVKTHGTIRSLLN